MKQYFFWAVEALVVGMFMIKSPSLCAEEKGFFRHVVSFAFRPEVTPDQKDEIVKKFLALKTEAKKDGQRYIVDIEFGLSNSREGADQGMTHNFLITFRSIEDRDFYVGKPFSDVFDPAHDAFKTCVGPLLRVNAMTQKIDGVFVTDWQVNPH